MKRINLDSVRCLGIGLIIAFAITLVGCGGSGYNKADRSSSHIEEFRKELLAAKAQIGTMMDAVNQVSSTADSDPRLAYETFQKELKNTERQAKRVQSRAEAIRKAGISYFKTWEAEYEKMASDEMKASFEKRKAELSAKYQKISEYSQQVDTDYKAFMKDVNDIQLSLGMDLTPKGIESVAGFIEKATADSKVVQDHIDQFIPVIDQVSAALSARTQQN